MFSSILNSWLNFLSLVYSLSSFSEIKLAPGIISTDDDHLNFIGGEWWQLMRKWQWKRMEFSQHIRSEVEV